MYFPFGNCILYAPSAPVFVVPAIFPVSASIAYTWISPLASSTELLLPSLSVSNHAFPEIVYVVFLFVWLFPEPELFPELLPFSPELLFPLLLLLSLLLLLLLLLLSPLLLFPLLLSPPLLFPPLLILSSISSSGSSTSSTLLTENVILLSDILPFSLSVILKLFVIASVSIASTTPSKLNVTVSPELIFCAFTLIMCIEHRKAASKCASVKNHLETKT